MTKRIAAAHHCHAPTPNTCSGALIKDTWTGSARLPCKRATIESIRCVFGKTAASAELRIPFPPEVEHNARFAGKLGFSFEKSPMLLRYAPRPRRSAFFLPISLRLVCGGKWTEVDAQECTIERRKNLLLNRHKIGQSKHRYRDVFRILYR